MGFDYISLRNAESDIRVATLLPGQYSDAIRLVLTHRCLRDPTDLTGIQSPQQLTLSEVQKSLPPDWVVAETLERKLLFEHEPSEKTTWDHPRPEWRQNHIHERLDVLPADSEPAYEALSYLWGSADDPMAVEVAQSSLHGPTDDLDGVQQQWTQMKVGQNLEAALRHLRFPHQPRTLWIDAICINQADDGEKAKQIVRMSSLYRMATRVIIWLGPASELEQSTLAMETLQHLGMQLELSCSTVRFAAPFATEPKWFRAVCPLPYTQEKWHAIRSLLSRPYFERLWIMQEVLLANSQTRVVCGRDEVAWYHFVRAIVCLLAKDTLPSDLRAPLEFVRALTWRSDQLSVPFIMNLGRQRKCSNIKDRIYGILGIVPPDIALSIKPDYNLPDNTVFVQAAEACMKYDQRLTLLQDCELSSPPCISPFDLAHRPSWVPDWSVPRQARPLSAFVFSSGASRACSQVIQSEQLQVRGRRLAKISRVSPKTPEDSSAILLHIREQEPHDLRTGQYISGGSLLDAFLFVLRMGYLDERWPGQSLPSLAEWRDYFLNNLHNANAELREEEISSNNAYLATSFLKGRTLVTTWNGHIGLAPAGAQPGDLACTILGCKSSILLRENPHNKRFHVVGECYIHGLDDVIGLLGPLPDGWRVQIRKDDSGHADYFYYNDATKMATQADPRLNPLPTCWIPFSLPRRPGTPALRSCFKNTETGEVIDSDPRLLPAALEAQGVSLEDFTLI